MASKAVNKTRTGTRGVSEMKNAESAVIPVIQEQATVTKRIVETGKVHISKHLREYDEIVDVPHLHEEVKIDRVPIDQVIETAPAVRTEGDVTIIPVVEERYVLEKRLVLVEELHVRKEKRESHHPQTVKVMKEEVEIKRIPPGEDRQQRQPRADPRR
jgi:uncharacterized protein (TIGR02271 family)